MNDLEIRKSFHENRLRRYHEDSKTLVIDELGLKHGKCRADIAVVNGLLVGFEIKGNNDSLFRLPVQIPAYNAVFDRIDIIITKHHLNKALDIIPKWWGIIVCNEGRQGALKFKTRRKAKINPRVDSFAVAQLLWRSEAAELLRSKGETGDILRKPRAFLYARLVELMSDSELRGAVRSCFMGRTSWRHLTQPYEHDGLSQPIAK